MNNLNRINIFEGFWKSVILVAFVSLLSFFFFSHFVPKFNFPKLSYWILGGVIAFVLLLVYFSVKILSRTASWSNQSTSLILKYIRLGILIGALGYAFIGAEHQLNDNLLPLWENLAFFGLLVFAIFPDILNWFVSNKPDYAFRRFAYGAVGKEHDRLGYGTIAGSEAIKLIQDVLKEKETYSETDSVVVKTISGEQGWGKSSFQRMIIESISPECILYTYISLTEVNNEQDFGKLFSERWQETLGERYPILTDRAIMPALKDIVRPQMGIFSSILDFIPSLIDPLVFWYKKIKLKIFPISAQRNIYANKDVSRAFFNLSSIDERAWIIVVDEIERSPLAEVYRVFEVIERFKALGRNGLPMQIIFLCIVDEKILKDRLSTDEGGNYKRLIDDFFFSSGIKTISGKIFLPPVSPSIKYQMVREDLNKILQKYPMGDWNNEQKSLLDNLTGIMPYISQDGSGSIEKKDQLEFAVGTLANKSPRLIEKVISRIDDILNTINKVAYPFNSVFFTLADVILMEYGKLEFFRFSEYVSKITPRITESHWAWRMDDIIPFSINTDRKGIPLDEGIQRTLNAEDKQPEQFVSLVRMLSPTHVNVFNQSGFENDPRYVHTLAWPPNMLRYLRSGWTENPDAYTKSVFYLQKMMKDGLDTTTIPTDDFKNFISFISTVRNEIKSDIYQNICVEGVRRINKREYPIQLDSYEGSPREEVIVSILRIISKMSEEISIGRPRNNEIDIQILATIFEKFIRSDLAVGEIYRIVDWTIRTDRGTSPRYLASIIPNWPNGGETEFKKIISSVMKKCFTRYYKSRSDIYKQEPLNLVQFALYQTWSKRDTRKDVKKLRQLASRKLHLHTSAINFLWRPLISTYQPHWKSFSDISGFGTWDTLGPSSVYLPIGALVFAAKHNDHIDPKIKEQLSFWEHISQSAEYRAYVKKTIESLTQNNEHTIHSYLIEHGYFETN